MAPEIALHPWEELETLVEQGDLPQLEEYLASLSRGDVARGISRLSLDRQSQLITMLEPADAAGLIEEIPHVQATGLIERLPVSAAASIVNELPSDEQADFLGDFDEQDAEAIIAQMAPEEARDARLLSQYAPDVAGGLMATEYLAFEEKLTVGDVIDELNGGADKYSDFDVQYVYVITKAGKLAGVLRIRDLVLSPRETRLTQIMLKSPLFVDVQTPLSELKETFERRAFFGIPVTDHRKSLVGVVRRRAVADAIAERADDDYLKSQGIVGGDELRSMPMLTRSRRRLSWLSVNIFLNIISASVIALYQDTLSTVIALAVFLPIISDMSGCSGNQAVAVSLRELSLGIVRPFEIFHVWRQEVTVGILNGIVLGSLIALAAFAWKGNPYLGAVVGAALALNTVLAVSIGGIVPLFLKQINKDPALASGPILTTITDMAGFFFVLSFAQAVLPLLQG